MDHLQVSWRICQCSEEKCVFERFSQLIKMSLTEKNQIYFTITQNKIKHIGCNYLILFLFLIFTLTLSLLSLCVCAMMGTKFVLQTKSIDQNFLFEDWRFNFWSQRATNISFLKPKIWFLPDCGWTVDGSIPTSCFKE
jgi:hypothetical protein